MTDKERQMVEDARMIICRWLAHQYGQQEQYIKLREASNLLSAIANVPEKRAAYEAMIKFGDGWNLYAAGFGPRPTGALVDTERSMKRRKISRSFIRE